MKIHLLFALLALCLSTPAHAQRVASLEEEQALARVYGGEEMVSIASGYQQPLSKAPAIATVITAADIKATGATDIDEVLETVPGLHVARNGESYSPIYTFRGIYSTRNQQVLMMINGIPITDVNRGGHSLYWGGMPVQAISRIEVVRGPGSALYGADAAAGVINIITKTGPEIDGTEVGGRVGSFDTHDGWFMHGGRWAGFEVAAMLESHRTEGQKRTIDADLQTTFDTLFNTTASRAPGPVDLQQNNLDARLDVSRSAWRLRSGLQQRELGMGTGMLGALAPDVRYSDDRWNADLTWHDPKVAGNWDVEAQLSYLSLAHKPDRDNVLFPPGVTLPIGANGQLDFGSTNLVTFANGYIGVPDDFSRTARAALSGNYAGFARHLLRMGGGYTYSREWVKESKNFGLDPATGLPINGAQVVDVSDTSEAYILGEPDRENLFLYLQDEWKFARDWALTGGLRYDHFSDFGNTVNPRLALVWETRYDLTTKLMYGSAFRAPAFTDMYFVHAPTDFSNPNLKPETMETLELSLNYRPRHDLHLGGSLFHYWWRDIIGFVPNADGVTTTAQNSGAQTGHGGELQVEWQASGTLKLASNYSYQKSTNDTLDHDTGNVPHHQVYLCAIWDFLPEWQFTPQVNWIIDRVRAAGDSRPAIADYTWVDLTLRRKNILNHVELAVSVRNLFDVDAREPSLASIPNDLPLAGRSVYGEVSYAF